MDLIVCRNSAGVGCGTRSPGNHGSGRDARFAPDCATRSAASGASADDADPMTRLATRCARRDGRDPAAGRMIPRLGRSG